MASHPSIVWPFVEETAASDQNLLLSNTDQAGKWRCPWEGSATALNITQKNPRPYINRLRVYGCTAYAYIKKEYRRQVDEIGARAKIDRLVAYDDDQRRIYWIKNQETNEILRA